MHAITALISGIRGAESGTAELYRRGTSTRATWYTSFEGDGATSTGADITLDSNGGYELYVDELVDVVAKSSTGTTVRSFTAGDSSPVVEVRSSSFTGTSYTSAASAVSNPTTLQAVLDLWNDNAGNTSAAIDWKVLLDGASTSLFTALGRLTGPLWYNVKDPTYGALGDNSNDDTAEIQEAIDVAAAATYGGVVYLPPGTYKVSATLTLPADVSLQGAGPVSTFLTMDHASNALISVTGSTARDSQFIRDMRLTVSQANTGNLITVGAGSRLIVDNCDIGAGTNVNGDCIGVVTSASTRLTIRDCILRWTSATASAINCAGAMARGVFINCIFSPPAACSATNGWVYGRDIDFIGCRFDCAAATSGTCSVYKANSTTLDATMTGCKFEGSGGATVTGMELGSYLAASKFIESGNSAPGYEDTNFTLYSYTALVAQAAADVQLVTRETRNYYLESNAASVAPDAKQYGSIHVHATGTTLATVTVTGMAPQGARLMFIYTGAGTTSITFEQSVEAGTLNLDLTNQVITNNFTSSALFMATRNDAPTGYWLHVGTPANNVSL